MGDNFSDLAPDPMLSDINSEFYAYIQDALHPDIPKNGIDIQLTKIQTCMLS